MSPDKIVYHVTPKGRPAFFTFIQAKAAAFKDAGGSFAMEVVDPGKIERLIERKLDALERLCVKNDFMNGPTIAYCRVAKGGGVDGMDFRDKGGQIVEADFNRGKLSKSPDSRYEIQARPVVPSEIAAQARGKLTPVELLVLQGEDPLHPMPAPRPVIAGGTGLVGRTFKDHSDRLCTIVPGPAGLSHAYVAVEREGDPRRTHESLAYVLSRLDSLDDRLMMARTLLAQADRLQREATALAAQAAAKDVPDEALQAMQEIESTAAQAADGAAQLREAMELDDYGMIAPSGPAPR